MHRDTRSIADREAKLEALHATLTDAVAQLTTEAQWRRAIDFAARFRRRSFSNSLLIYVQHTAAFEAGRVNAPTPTYVAGYGQWQHLGRQVLKGQTGYMIFAPVTRRMVATHPDTGPWRTLDRGEKPDPVETVRTRMIGVRPAYVWDVSQTDGDPLPAPPRSRLLEGAAPPGLWDGLATQARAAGFTVGDAADADGIRGANGQTNHTDHTVTVRADMDDAARVKTLAHELAHVILHGPDNDEAGTHRGVAEVEAESVALMTLAAHGVDTSRFTVPYVATWAATVSAADPVQVVTATFDRVRTTALAILDRLDTTQVSDGTPPPLPDVSPAAGSSATTPRVPDSPAAAASRETQGVAL
ncbi:ArdC-like ssDNA-binding domain-containing protein [Isoptericola sp. NPDC019482]|uniref:ArdC-like ssDNA-binding domain-containing protein n=1 Tax=Isoptericola sp. NPDC019482 TaxID=3154688 RepID=UPI003484CCE6